MYEYEVMNAETGERAFMWGGNLADALRKSPGYASWKVIFIERICD